MNYSANLETARTLWAKVAQEHGWYAEPFFVQVWVDRATGETVDSVATKSLTEDVVIEQEENTCDCPECDADGDRWERAEDCLRGFCSQCLTALGFDEDWGARCERCAL